MQKCGDSWMSTCARPANTLSYKHTSERKGVKLLLLLFCFVLLFGPIWQIAESTQMTSVHMIENYYEKWSSANGVTACVMCTNLFSGRFVIQLAQQRECLTKCLSNVVFGVYTLAYTFKWSAIVIIIIITAIIITVCAWNCKVCGAKNKSLLQKWNDHHKKKLLANDVYK